MSQDAKTILDKFIDESHKEPIDLMKVTPKSLGMSEDDFYAALKELEKLGYIKNILWGNDGGCLYDDIEIETPNFKLGE